MYEKYFDIKKQEKMRENFLQLGKKGIIKNYEKNSSILIQEKNSFCIVMDGKLKQSIYSNEGEEKTLYILRAGEIFGEMDYFCGDKSQLVVKSVEKSKVSFVNEKIMEEILTENPALYRDIIHSIVRKFRIVMFQMANIVFGDSYGRVADTLVRLYSQEGNDEEIGKILNDRFTHEEIANLIGCSRITVTRVLNDFKEEGLIQIQKGRILIKNIEGLKKYIKI